MKYSWLQAISADWKQGIANKKCSLKQAVHMLSRSSDVHFAPCIIYLSPGIETELGNLSTLWSMY